MTSLSSLLPGLYVAALAALLGWALRRWYDPIPRVCWAIWSTALVPVFAPVLLGSGILLPLGYLTRLPPFTSLWRGTPPGNLIQSDVILLILPWLVQIRHAFAAGAWPLWNHLSGAGEPLLANPQSQALQPLAWLAFPFPVQHAVAVTAALKVLLAFVFTYLLLRRLRFSLHSALWASLAFGLAGFLQQWLGWPLSAAAAFLPLLLYSIVLVAERDSRSDRLLLTIAVAALASVGHPESELHVAVLATCFAVSRLLAAPVGQRRRITTRWLVAAGLGGVLAAPALLPAVDFIPQTLRSDLLRSRHEAIQSQGLPAGLAGDRRYGTTAGAMSRLLPIVAPNAFGNNRLGAYWGVSNTVEDATSFSGNAAFLALLLAFWPLRRRAAAVAAAEAPPPVRFPAERLMIATTLVAAFMLACPPQLVQFLDAVPILRESLFFHTRVSLLFNFATAYVAACTWERWQRQELRRSFVLPTTVLIAALLVWAYRAHPAPNSAWAFGPVRLASLALHLTVLASGAIWLAQSPRLLRTASRPLALALAWGGSLLIAGELLAIHAPANPSSPSALYFPSIPSVDFIRARLDAWHRMAGMGAALRPNLETVYGLADPRSANPLKPSAYLEATHRINRFPQRPADGFIRPEDPLYGLLGVQWVMTPPERPAAVLEPPLHLALDTPEATVYERSGALARLFLPASSSLCTSVSWSDCTAGIHDFGAQAAMREGSPQWRSGTGLAQLHLLALAPDDLHARAELSEPRLLASSVYQDGGWKLLLNGTRHPTTLANGPFIAAWLPAGEATIDLLYRPRGFVVGLLLSALAAVGIAAFVIPPPFRTRRRSQASTSVVASRTSGGPQRAVSEAASR
jgi:hypothetical protein